MRKNDRIGQRVGKVVVIGRVPDHAGRREKYLCRCDCGKEVELSRHVLRDNHPLTSCGCTDHLRPRKPHDITGLRVGRLVVVRLLERREFGKRVWECRCDCGNTCEKRLDLLKKRLPYYSCGCLTMACAICEKPFVPTRKNARLCDSTECKAEDKRRAINARNRGDFKPGNTERTCVVCQKPFLGHAMAKICSRECLAQRHRETQRKLHGVVMPTCKVCGKVAEHGLFQRYSCSKECSAILRDRKNRRAVDKILPKVIQKRKERRRTDPEYAEHLRGIDRRYLQRKAARKQEQELREIQEALQKKLEERPDVDRDQPPAE